MTKFKVGDIVRLNSGGLPMTVWGVVQIKPTLYEVVWFSGSILHRDVFSEPEIFPEEDLKNLLDTNHK